MSPGSEVNDLRQALLDRAREHAEEILAHGRESARLVLEEKREDLRERERGEEEHARLLGARAHRQRLERSRLEARKELEQARWELAASVLRRVEERLREMGEDEKRYLPLFTALLKRAAQAAPAEALVAQVNERDLERLKTRWDAIAREAAPEKTITLADEPIACLGGLRLRDPDDRVRVDATLDARIRNVRQELVGVVMDRLFGDRGRVEDVTRG